MITMRGLAICSNAKQILDGIYNTQLNRFSMMDGI